MRRVTELPENERPYERFYRLGAEALNDRELLAILLRSGTSDCDVLETADRVLSLARERGGLSGMYHLMTSDLLQIPGIGKVKAMQLLAMSELARRMAKEPESRTEILDSPDAIADRYMEEMRHLEVEELRLILLDSKNGWIGDKMLTRGTVNASLISAREIFKEALRYGAVKVVLVHNHPSGDPTPSREDIEVTRQVAGAGLLVGVPLLDHIILGDRVFTSLRERGILDG